MSVNCTSCGHGIPSGQFRCGKCGAAQTRDSSEDFAALGEVTEGVPRPAFETPLHLGVGPEIKPRPSPQDAIASEARTLQVGPEPTAPRDEEPKPRESIVPKGTFTSDAPQSPPTETSTSEDAKPATTKPATSDHSGRIPHAARTARSDGSTGPIATGTERRAPKARPPFLASAILREDYAPSEPGKSALSRVLVTAATFGMAASLFANAEVVTLVFVPLFVGLIVLSRIELSYTTRAACIGALAGLGLSVASFWRVAEGGRVEGPYLSASVTLLASALLFRAWYRGSNLSRVLVAVALVFALAWAAMTSHRGLLELGFAWTSWLPALTWYLFVILCLLSLLAFMGNETTGGCDVWALGLFSWFGLFAVVRYATETSASSAQALLGLLEPALSAPLSVALAQLLARALGPRCRRVEQALTS